MSVGIDVGERYRAGMAVRATVRNGRLSLDEPTELPEGTVIDLVIDDEGDELDEEQRQALHAAIERSLQQAKNGQTASAGAILARYAAAGVHARPNGHPRGEIIYDSPDLRRTYGDRLRSEPQIRLLETGVQFRTYLYRRLGGYHGLASQDPLALVEWRYSERWESAGAEARRTHTDVRVLGIRPNPPEPPSLDDAIREYPFG